MASREKNFYNKGQPIHVTILLVVYIYYKVQPILIGFIRGNLTIKTKITIVPTQLVIQAFIGA